MKLSIWKLLSCTITRKHNIFNYRIFLRKNKEKACWTWQYSIRYNRLSIKSNPIFAWRDHQMILILIVMAQSIFGNIFYLKQIFAIYFLAIIKRYLCLIKLIYLFYNLSSPFLFLHCKIGITCLLTKFFYVINWPFYTT